MGGVGAVACVYAAAYASDMPADIFVTHAVRFARSAYTVRSVHRVRFALRTLVVSPPSTSLMFI